MVGVNMKKGCVVGVFLLVFFIGLILPLTSGFSFFEEKKNFDVDNALLKLVIKEGESASKTLKIISHEDADFRIEKNGLEFIDIDDLDFFVKKGEEINIDVLFNNNDLEAGVYFGELVIVGKNSVVVPVIMEIESKDILFDGNINIPLDYVNTYSGENTAIENKLFNLENIGLKNVEVSYLLENSVGKVVFSDEENIAIESQVLNTKVISIPEDSEEGNYLFTSIVRYKNSVGTSSYLFRISNKPSNYLEDNFFMWIVIVLLIVLLFFVFYYTKKRDLVLVELQKEYKKELNNGAKIIEEERRKAKIKGNKKDPTLKKIEKKHAEKIRTIETVYRDRIKTIKVLRKKKRESEISKKLKQWKKQGYNIGEILDDKKIVRNNAGKYRREGYDL